MSKAWKNSEEVGLKKLLEKYFTPPLLDQANNDEDLPRPLKKTKSRSEYRIKGNTITHQQEVYPSSTISKKILSSNRETYSKIMQKMEHIEENKYVQIILKAREQKQRLNFFKMRIKGYETNTYRALKPNVLPNLGGGSASSINPKVSPAVAKILKARQTAILPYKWRMLVTGGYYNEAREGATLTKLMVQNSSGETEERIYLFGGLSRELHSTLTYLVNPAKWVLVGKEQNKNLCRYSHAACAWRNKLVIVGGSRFYNKDLNRRDCLDDIFLFDPKEEKWTQMFYKGTFTPRRGHIACFVGNQLLVNGGIDPFGNYLNDCITLNCGKKPTASRLHKWTPVKLSGEPLPPLAYHAAQLVISPERQMHLDSMDVYNFPAKYNSSDIGVEGLYAFGGITPYGVRGDLMVLKMGQSPCEWAKVAAKGKPPTARYGHTMNYVQDKNMLVIFGGRTNVGQKQHFNDVWIISLIELEWIKLQYRAGYGILPEPRYSHCAAVFNNDSVITLGGLGEERYCSAKVYCLDLEEKSPLEEFPLTSEQTCEGDVQGLPSIDRRASIRAKSLIRSTTNKTHL